MHKIVVVLMFSNAADESMDERLQNGYKINCHSRASYTNDN